MSAPWKVTIGRIVTYRSRTGDYDLPAIVTATVDTLNPKGVEAGAVKPLESPEHVHLTVFTAGEPGMRTHAEDFEEESEYPRSENVAGCYQEWNIAPDHLPATTAPGEPTEQKPGTWRWPARA